MQDLAKIQLDLATMEKIYAFEHQHWSDFSIAFIVKCAIPYCFLYDAMLIFCHIGHCFFQRQTEYMTLS